MVNKKNPDCIFTFYIYNLFDVLLILVFLPWILSQTITYTKYSWVIGCQILSMTLSSYMLLHWWENWNKRKRRRYSIIPWRISQVKKNRIMYIYELPLFITRVVFSAKHFSIIFSALKESDTYHIKWYYFKSMKFRCDSILLYKILIKIICY